MRLGLSLSLGGSIFASGYVPPVVVPINITAPTITGDLTNGSTLTANLGTWTGTPTSYSVQWYRDGVAIGSPIVIAAGDPAPTRTYSTATDEGRALTIGVVATNADGSSIEVISPARIGLYDPVVYSTTFQPGGTGPRLIDQPGWASNGGFNVSKLLVGPPLLITDGIGATPAALLDTGSTIPRIRFTPARNPGEDNSTSGRYYHVAAIDYQNFIGFIPQQNGYSFLQFVANVNSDVGSEYGFVNDEGTEWELELNTDESIRYIRVYRKAIGATEFTQTPGSIAANGGKGFGPFDAALNSATKAGIGGSVGWAVDRPRHTLEYSVRVQQANSVSITVGTQVRSPADPNKMRVTLTGSYTGTVDNLQFYVTLADGTTVLPWFAGSAITGSTINQTIDVPLTDGQSYIVWARDPDVPSSATSANGTALILPQIGDAVLGMNEGYVTVWNSADPYQDLANRFEWRTSTFGYIQPRSVPVSGGIFIGTSADGEGGTVKMDLDGRIYPYNTAGLSAYCIAFPAYYSETGDYVVPLAPGLSITPNGTPTMAWSYNSSTGDLTFTVPSLASQYMFLAITTASMPAGGLKLSCRKVGTTIVTRALRPVAAANINQVSTFSRNMTESAVNNWRNSEGGRTDTALPVDTPANTWTGYTSDGGINPNQQLAYADGGRGLWINEKHTAGDALISARAAIFASSSSLALAVIEVSNEVWNRGFDSQFHESLIAGCRRGYAPIGVVTHAAAVPETIIDGRPYINRDNRLVSGRSFTTGDKIYVDWSGVGSLILVASTTINPGATIAIGSNVTQLYDNTATYRAGLRWLATRSKEVRAPYDAAFAAAGKPRPLLVLAWQAALPFSTLIDALDFDSNYLAVDRISTAPYWGGGVGGIDYGPYENTGGGWTEAARDKWYAGDSAGFISSACTAFLTGIDSTFATVLAYSQAVANYSKSRRGDKNAIRLNFYEISHHIQFSGWPDMAGAWDNTSTYSNKQFVWSNPATGGDGKTYRAKLAVPANTPVSNTTYWGVFVDGNGTTWDATKTNLHRDSTPRGYLAAWNALSRSQAFAEQCQGYFFDRIVNESGCVEIAFFDRMQLKSDGANAQTSQVGAILPWFVQYTEGDNDMSGGAGTNWMMKMLSDLNASL